MRTRQEWWHLRERLCSEADRQLGISALEMRRVWQATLTERGPLQSENWWGGIGPATPAKRRKLEQAARAYSRGQRLPRLSVPTRARLLFRIRMAAAVCLVMSGKYGHQVPTGWLPNTLAAATDAELLECLVVECWPILNNLVGEALGWADGVCKSGTPPCQ